MAGTVGGFSVPAALGGDILAVTGLDQTQVPTVITGGGKPGAIATTAGTKTPATERAAATKSAAGKNTAGKSTAAASAAPSFPCSQYWGQYTASIPEASGHTSAPTALCGYTPNQIRQAYGVASSPYTGKGATIAIIES